jgi:hypothetical protein
MRWGKEDSVREADSERGEGVGRNEGKAQQGEVVTIAESPPRFCLFVT